MTRDIRICFIGDSFVNGTGDETALGWAGRLCAAANAQGAQLTYYNLGIRRDTSGDILRRWEAECLRRLPAGCDGRVVISCGVNDTVIEAGRRRVEPEQSCLNVRTLLHTARRYPVLMVGPPPVADAGQNQRIQEISEAFAREAGRLDVPFIELFSRLAADQEYLAQVAGNDGAHPVGAGYARMAGIIAASPLWWFARR